MKGQRVSDIIPPGEIAFKWSAIQHTGAWQEMSTKYNETTMDWLDAQWEGILLNNAAQALKDNKDLLPDVVKQIKEKLKGFLPSPMKGGWSYRCPGLDVAAWLEIHSISVHGLRVKSCRKCDSYFVPSPPQRMLCNECKGDYTWQTIYRQKQAREKNKIRKQARNPGIHRGR